MSFLERKISGVYVVVKKDDEYWGEIYENSEGWTTIDNAKFCDPEFTLKPTDLTYTPSSTHRNPYFIELSKPGVELIKISKTVTTEFKLV